MQEEAAAYPEGVVDYFRLLRRRFPTHPETVPLQRQFRDEAGVEEDVGGRLVVGPAAGEELQVRRRYPVPDGTPGAA